MACKKNLGQIKKNLQLIKMRKDKFFFKKKELNCNTGVYFCIKVNEFINSAAWLVESASAQKQRAVGWGHSPVAFHAQGWSMQSLI